MKPEIPRVLIVDDEMDICFLLSNMCRGKNVSSSCANSLSEAQISMKINPPSVLILDNHLPDGLGIEFIGYVKKHYPRTRIVMITAHDTPSDETIALQNGADFFIGKPFSIKKVRETIEDLIN
jgi:two-component system OmpR family response regulator